MAKIIKVAEVQRRRRERAKAKRGVEVKRRRRERANNALAIVLRLKQGFENVIANVMADQDQESYLTVLFAVQPAVFQILLPRLSDDEKDRLMEGIRDRTLPGL
jgi:hypothetical protein